MSTSIRSTKVGATASRKTERQHPGVQSPPQPQRPPKDMEPRLHILGFGLKFASEGMAGGVGPSLVGPPEVERTSWGSKPGLQSPRKEVLEDER
eukprot:CAMPEP_0206627540 /NCGR_PEP_ID=MMETSP0325_2-20121206/66022_1 /ASSEMBLY_ACC=CAM_ASM_000347 /TAXON_ID=2866 /ORGANISM="Crypthecodinium cohnii, Strain Seligo" /LENGTH=93 /DNA_ID=CAMNT_0054152195 /DNA_START=344 /DNA_END=625 /DNA_ORIENTATION=+